ncbi:MAG: hypothetical protein COS89_06715 [Deltaproteobacteria bacterium CG07_land_8_20_14_0_80_38_7]|nr:MAG: hypothetical protein COS89_06715 [Deltaproteobacteria bacterium CG07_land_8_20_14_0_80_38_7]
MAYAVLSYLFWIIKLAINSKSAIRETDRIAGVYLLFGQVIAFLIPLSAAIAIFIFEKNLPLNYIAPITVVLPVASLVGIILGNLRNTQLKLVQTEKMASLGHLIAGVAHEINNPTTFIYSNLSILREYVSYIKNVTKPDAPKFKNEISSKEVLTDLSLLIDNVSEGATRIKNIVTDLRRFGHSQDDVITKVDIKAGIESTLNLLQHEIKEGIAVHLDVDQNIFVTGNSGQLNQVWMNLFTNAIHGMDKKGHLWIIGYEDAKKVYIKIRDDGKGISKDTMNHIFEPFFTTKPEGQGTGLGLSICQQIIHRWKGEIIINSEQEAGTTVQVIFPKTN